MVVYWTKKWSRNLTRSIYVISAVVLLIEGAPVCPPGRMPPDCQNVCRLGYFGSDCVSPCPATCQNRTCEPDTGFCYRCQLGFTGLNCSHWCHRGFFGQDCNRSCPSGCFRKECDPFTGLCGKCVPGYEGSRCETHYLLRNHTNNTASNLSHGAPLQKSAQTYTYVNAAVYISAAIVICMMSLSSVALCSYLEKLKARQKDLKPLPIYRKHSLTVLPSSFLRWSGAPAKQEYIEMDTIDSEYDTASEADVMPHFAANTVSGREMGTGKCCESTPRNNGKHLLALLNRWKAVGRDGKRLPVLPKDTGEYGLNPDDVAASELRKVLKINAPLRVGQAANYSHNLYFKSYLPSPRFASDLDERNDNVKEQQELIRPFRLSDPTAVLSLLGEQRTEKDTKNMEVIAESGQRATESAGEWYSPRTNSHIDIIGGSSFMPKDSSQKTHTMLNLARDLLQNVKHRTHPLQPASGSWPKDEDSSCASVLPRNSDNTVLNDDVTPQSEKITDTAVLAEVTNGHRSRVYAETTQPLLKSGSLLRHARKSLITFMRRAGKYWTRDDIYESVSEDQRRAVEIVEPVKPEITQMYPEQDNQEETGKSEFLCNCLDCELKTEAREFDLQYISRGLQSQAKEHYTDMVVLGVAANADTIQDQTKCQRQFTCSTFQYSEDDASGINRYIIGILSRQVDSQETVNDSPSQANSDVSNDSSYATAPRENVEPLVTVPANDGHNMIYDNICSQNSNGVGQDSGIVPLPVTSGNHLSSRRFSAEDVTNNLSFCCTNKEPYTGTQKITDLTAQKDVPQISASCPERMDMLPELCKSQHIHDPCIESYNQKRFRGSPDIDRIHTAKSNRRWPSHSFSDPAPHLFETSFKNTVRPQNVAEVGAADLDTLSIKAFPDAGMILLSLYRAKMKQKLQTNTGEEVIDETDQPAYVDSCIPEITIEPCTTEIPPEDCELGSEAGNKCQTPLQLPVHSVDENPQGSNIGRDLGEYVSLIPKSVISLTVRKQPNMEIKPAYTGDLDMQGTCEYSQPEDMQRHAEM